MSAVLPDELKLIQPWLQRSKEIGEKEPIVSYFIKYYALQQALALASFTSKPFLFTLMDELEKDKSVLDPISIQDENAYKVMEAFAMKVFVRADNEDRSPNASKNTAKLFFAAAQFMEVMSVFGEVDSSIMEKIKYAKFRAVEIVRLVKEGKTVVGHQVISLASPTIEIEVIRNEKPTKLKVAEDVACEMYHEDEPPFPIIRFMTPEVIVGKRMKRISLTECKDDGENDENKGDNDNDGDNGSDNDVANERDDPFEIDYTIIHTAQKQARFAISSMEYEDIDSAITHLQKAVALLNEIKLKD